MGLYGPGFERGATVLVILCAGQFFNAATGAVAYLLMMTGHERLVRNNLAFWALVNIGLGLFLIPKFGMAGAAAVTAFVVGGQNLTAVALVRRKLGILLLGARLTGR
jgi:O-antigen/teichoic acid export membrane protein